MRPAILNFLFSEVTCLPGVGTVMSKAFGRLCGTKVKDVLYHFPVYMVARPVLKTAADIQWGTYGTLAVEIVAHHPPVRRKAPYVVEGRWQEMPVDLVFFHTYPDYMGSAYPIGQTRWVSGKIENGYPGIKIMHPDYVSKTKEAIPTLEPAYALTQGITSKMLRKKEEAILAQLPDLPEWQEPPVLSWGKSLHILHESGPDAKAHERLAYDELLANQLALFLSRKKMAETIGIQIQASGTLWKQLKEELPFSLTGAQERVIREITHDMNAPKRMNRLLQGDVGSGKTLVALAAILYAVEAGGQAAFMAPTDILARQHFQELQARLKEVPVKIALLTAREKGKVKQEILQGLQAGTIDVLIGTHALITEQVTFKNLRLAVIDEQHKFGVKQRLELVKKGVKTDLLLMTATPIPRTLALTVYGDMDVSVIDEKPLGRSPIQTSVMSSKHLSELIEKLHRVLEEEKETQVYWVCPLVEESEKTDLMAAEKRFSELREIFGDRVALVHGKMKGPEKDEIMGQFVRGEKRILVSTTVIEVGVNVPTARLMVVEHAERFGLAALHQLRGRIGRGPGQAVCILMHGFPLSATAKERLSMMRATDDGFKIAEADLRLRGAGEVLGTRQSGLPEFKVADLEQDEALLRRATQEARQILETDPELSSDRGKNLRILLYLFEKDKAIQTLKAG